jgi:hypothetical protein
MFPDNPATARAERCRAPLPAARRIYQLPLVENSRCILLLGELQKFAASPRTGEMGQQETSYT